jgi:hypothetical protein
MNDITSGENKKLIVLLYVPFALIFFDSVLAYFCRPRGIYVTGNILTPLFLLIFALKYGLKPFLMPKNIIVWLTLLTISLMLATVTADNIDSHRSIEAIGCSIDFISGYMLFKNEYSESRIAKFYMFIVSVYVVVCVLALSKVNPALFPVTYAKWFELGYGAVLRPKITADQNMQIYYLFPVLLVFVFRFKIITYAIASILAILGAYILVSLQSRSGVMVFIGVFMLSIMFSVRNNGVDNKIKPIIVILASLCLAIIFIDKIYAIADPIIHRFKSNDISTGNGRLGSTMYMFEHLFDPTWWLPRGPEEFLEKYGGLPHSNLTAIFLDGGIIGLVSWIALIIVPIFKVTIKYIKVGVDNITGGVMIASWATLLTQLSLNNPIFDQVWLWAGACVAVNYKTTFTTTDQKNIERKPKYTNIIGAL